jgi:hypothetical protein
MIMIFIAIFVIAIFFALKFEYTNNELLIYWV